MYLLYDKYPYYQEAQNISNRSTVNLFIYKSGRVKDEYLDE